MWGDPGAPRTIVLIGDSHAGQFTPTLATFVERHPGWRLKVVQRQGCPFSTAPPEEAGAPFTVCSDQNRSELQQVIQLHPSPVITAAMSPESYEEDLHWTWPSVQAQLDGYRAVLAPLTAAGIRVAVIREVPRPTLTVPLCLQQHPNDASACDTPRAAAFPAEQDPLVTAGRSVPGVSVVHLTPWLCDARRCPAVIDNVVTFRDNHITATFARSLSVPVASSLGLS